MAWHRAGNEISHGRAGKAVLVTARRVAARRARRGSLRKARRRKAAARCRPAGGACFGRARFGAAGKASPRGAGSCEARDGTVWPARQGKAIRVCGMAGMARLDSVRPGGAGQATWGRHGTAPHGRQGFGGSVGHGKATLRMAGEPRRGARRGANTAGMARDGPAAMETWGESAHGWARLGRQAGGAAAQGNGRHGITRR